MMEWINYKEHQPDERGVYLVRLSDGQIKVMAYETAFARIMPMVKYSEKTAGWYTEESEMDMIFEVINVTHWQPLPEPPQPEPPQINKEKALKALEHHKETAVCNGCPYSGDDDTPQGYCPIYDDAIALLREQKMGHWIFLTNCSNSGVYCSECNTKVFDRYPFKKKFSYFCPHCGTRMEGEVERL